MAQTAPTVGIAELLAHAAWARRVANYVAASSADAEDAVQDAWLAALEHPPTEASTAQPWLGAVVRNAVRARFRSASRRQQREQAVAGTPTALPSTENLLAAAQMQRQLADAVLELDEPYRTTVLLRFYQELSSAEIARQLGIPEGTVRWRLKTAIDHLRAELEKTQRQDLKHWVAALAPGLPSPTVPTTISATLLKGSLVMKTVTATVVVAAIVAAILFYYKSSSSTPTQTELPPPLRRAAMAAPALAPAAAEAPVATAPRQRLSPTARATRLQQMAAAKAAAHQPEPSALPTSGTTPQPHTGDIDPAYVKARIVELRPYLIECYQNTLATDPTMQGNITVRFTIVGEPEVGGLVGESEIDDDASTIKNPDFRQCIQESMYAANFEPPVNGGTVEVRYPFSFSNTP